MRISLGTVLFPSFFYLACSSLHAENLTPNLKFNGFASGTISLLNNDQGGEYITDFYGHPGISETTNAGLESLIGLQFDYRINSQMNIVTQLSAQGRNNFDAYAEWAYFGYQINDNVRFRAGRLGLPAFMYSDTIHVGQSYPWARLPQEVYNDIPVTNFDGVDLLYRQPLNDWSLDAQFLYGSSSPRIFRLDNSIGANISLSNESFTARLGIIETRITMDVAKYASIPCPPVPGSFCDVTREKTTFLNAGILYDDGHWFFASEMVQLQINGWLADWQASHVSAGRYFGKLLPYIQLSKLGTMAADECTPFAPLCTITYNEAEQSTIAIGVRYALKNTVSLKSQLDYVSDFHGTKGLTNGAMNGSALGVPKPFYVLTLGLTASF